MGYDGKGQIRVKTREELTSAWDQLKNVPCVLEKMLPLRPSARSSWRVGPMGRW
jgi:5-(carboxyamino)imidazole ribonucleotide synthase